MVKSRTIVLRHPPTLSCTVTKTLSHPTGMQILKVLGRRRKIAIITDSSSYKLGF